MYLKFEIVEKDLIAESTNPRPLCLVVCGLQMAFKTFKFGKGFVAPLLLTDVYLVLGGDVILSLGVAVELLVAEEAIDLRVLPLVLGLDVGVDAGTCKTFVTRNTKIRTSACLQTLVFLECRQIVFGFNFFFGKFVATGICCQRSLNDCCG